MVLVAANAQETDNHLRDKILQIKEMWYIGVTGDSLYWELVAEGLEVVPAAIALIDDTTETKAAVSPLTSPSCRPRRCSSAA